MDYLVACLSRRISNLVKRTTFFHRVARQDINARSDFFFFKGGWGVELFGVLACVKFNTNTREARHEKFYGTEVIDEREI